MSHKVEQYNDQVFPVVIFSLPFSSDGMVGQVSPEALFSRLQTEGSKTEAESEVRTQLINIYTCICTKCFVKGSRV